MILDIFGWAGTFLIVLAYYGTSCGRIKVESRIYHVMNLAGAVAVGASVFPKQAWPAFVLQIVWGSVALGGLVRIFRLK